MKPVRALLPTIAGQQNAGRNFVPGLVLLNTVLLLAVLALIGSHSPLPAASQASVGGLLGGRAAPRTAASGAACADAVAGLRAQLASLLKLRVAYGEMYCEKHGIGPTGGFCVKREANGSVAAVGGNDQWDAPVCARMAELFAGKSVLDFGCGMGLYGKCLAAANKGVRWTGMDGSEGIEAVTDGVVKFADLTVPQFLEETFDWVVSLEVGEHIPVEFEATLLDNIVRHARDGVLLTWAVPNQYGFHHVSERTNEYVIGRMRERGFEYDEDLSAELRGIAVLKWFKNTIMVFHRA